MSLMSDWYSSHVYTDNVKPLPAAVQFHRETSGSQNLHTSIIYSYFLNSGNSLLSITHVSFMLGFEKSVDFKLHCLILD